MFMREKLDSENFVMAISLIIFFGFDCDHL
jgi:hypothetical protein